MATKEEPIEAIVFDLGGVVLGSPLQGIAEYEQQHGIPSNFVNINVATRGRSGAFARLERGELALEPFYLEFKQELESKEQLETYFKFKKMAYDASLFPLTIDTRLLFDMMMEKSLRVDPLFLHAIYILRGNGFKVGALTNNFAPMDSAQPGAINIHAIQSLFDQVVESVLEGVRKPDAKAFQVTAQKLHVSNLRNICFLDDIGTNVKGAQALGMETILVKLKDKAGALSLLETILRRRNALSPSFSLLPSGMQVLFWNLPQRGKLVGSAFGHGANPPVIFFHGGGQTRHAWEKTARTLAASGFFALTIDLKGHGDSYWDVNKDYTCFSIGRDVDSLLVQSGLLTRKPILIGASLGGLSCMCSERINQCGGLILVDVTPKLEAHGVNRVLDFMSHGTVSGYASLEEAAKAIQVYTKRATSETNSLEGLKKNLRFDEAKQRYYPHYDPNAFSKYTGDLEEQARDFNEMERLLLENASRITVPMLLVRGQQTDIVGQEGIANLKSAAPQMKLVTVSNAGHMVAGDQNDLFASEVVSFAMGLRSELVKTIALVDDNFNSPKL